MFCQTKTETIQAKKSTKIQQKKQQQQNYIAYYIQLPTYYIN